MSVGPFPPVSRRSFLQTGLSLSGGLVIALQLPACSEKPKAAGGAPRTIEANAWLRIGTDDSITFLCDRSEMGQGVHTALPMLLAEELGVDLGRVRVEFAPAGTAYVNDMLGSQMTGGSTSVRQAWEKLRRAGAQARTMLVAAAAKQWEVPVAGLRVENGTVVSTHGKRLSFGALAEAAAKLPPPKDVELKRPGQFTLIGRGHPRLDTPAKVDGSAQFGIDVRLPGMLYAALAQTPVLGGRLKRFDDAKAKAMPGVRAVVQTSTGVAVVADSWWRARRARDALQIEWEPGPNVRLDNAAIFRSLRRVASGEGKAARTDGDTTAALRSATRVLRADYELPLLAHATLEPQNCTAQLTAEGCDLYVPTQGQLIAQAVAAKVAGLPPEKVRVHTTFLGGGFGRRIEPDFIPAAVEAAKAVGAPVKLVWTREDDMTHDTYRPPAFDQVAGGFDAAGRLIAWHLHLVGPSISARTNPAVLERGVDPAAIEGAENFPYDVPNVLVDFLPQEIGIDVGYWRSVSHSLNCFVVESFMDELAHAAQRDPVELRMSLLARQPRHRRVLELAAREAGYGQAPKGRSHGVALVEGYGTYMAQVAEVSIEEGRPKVHRVTCALDCGQVVNPDTVVAQVEGGVIFGLSAALWGEINLQNGRVQQTNFDSYRIVRLSEAPKIDTFVVDSHEAPGGIGEPATALIAPAVCNAIFAATGRRLRSLPIARHSLA